MSRAVLYRGAVAVTAAAALLSAGLTQASPAVAKDKKATTRWGDDTTGEGKKGSSGGTWDPNKDLGSLSSAAKTIGLTDARKKGATGAGVDVALIDTGVTPVPGLGQPGKLIAGPDLSFDAGPKGSVQDDYGHGTHLAGIIAGQDVTAGKDGFQGIASGSRVVSVKVGAANGAVDVSQVIAAIDWTVQHSNDDGLNIRVINLSYGTDATSSPATDPLAFAVENAWRHGIVVVAAAGNAGLDTPRLDNPAVDPFVIAVAAADHVGTEKADDDVVADFTSRGSTARHPDVTAPGKSVVSLRDPGSTVDRDNPQALVPGDRDQRYFRGSGTSQAAAVVSGSVAVLLGERPELTPDQVKSALMSTARPLKNGDLLAQGSGMIDVESALKAKVSGATQPWTPGTGLGSLEQARGTAHVYDAAGVPLIGEFDVAGQPWDGRRWSASATAGTSWSGGVWNGRRWSGDDWSAVRWSDAGWSGRRWSGAQFSGRRWSDDVWDGHRWTGRRWSGVRWSGVGWSGDRW